MNNNKPITTGPQSNIMLLSASLRSLIISNSCFVLIYTLHASLLYSSTFLRNHQLSAFFFPPKKWIVLQECAPSLAHFIFHQFYVIFPPITNTKKIDPFSSYYHVSRARASYFDFGCQKNKENDTKIP